MAMREMALCLALSGLTVTASAQPDSTPETWTPVSRTAQTITGRVRFSPSEITFQNGKSLALAPGGQMLFRAEAKKKKVMADLYRITSLDDPLLENGTPSPRRSNPAFVIDTKRGRRVRPSDDADVEVPDSVKG